ncbi:MAG: hypothetical protein LBD06_06925 [Candidatus Accumulibacter sp.]|nr:hypothetical protein [Accumulibacter sp.]
MRGQRTEKPSARFFCLLRGLSSEPERSVFRSSSGAKRRKLICLLSSLSAVLRNCFL